MPSSIAPIAFKNTRGETKQIKRPLVESRIKKSCRDRDLCLLCLMLVVFLLDMTILLMIMIEQITMIVKGIMAYKPRSILRKIKI